MNMGVEIKRIVQELSRVTINQVLQEAIMNAIHAKAKDIDINVSYKQMSDDLPCYIDSMYITDNGEGFTEENTNSFKIYKTTHKQNIGAKGIGRFLFLKLFNEVIVNSLDKKIKFNIDDVNVSTVNKVSNETVISFLQVKQEVSIDLKKIENNIKEHFLPYFNLMKDKPKITINFTANDEKLFTIDSKDIPNLKTDTFKLKKYTFTINYILEYYDSQRNNGFYCANNRIVIKNNTTQKQKPQLIKLKTFGEVNVLFLLSGEYLDKEVNETRDNFDIHPKNKNSMFDELSWEDVQDSLSEKLLTILLESGIDIKAKAEENLDSAIGKVPYLSEYLTENPYGKNSEKLIENAEKLLYEDKKTLRENKYKNQQEYQEKLAIITHTELAEYIFDRQKIIDNLQKITNQQELEEKIHNLFMKKNTSNDNQDYTSNNLWLFDDRFMVYDKVFSDNQVKDIFPELDKNLDKPDILIIISNTYDREKITDIVIIEFKKPSVTIMPAGAEEQLLKYARYVNQSNNLNKIRIWTYAFLTFGINTISALEDKSYNKIPTQSEHSIYYKYHEANNVIINFMDYKALANDADTRNKTFMNILTSNAETNATD